MIDDNNYLDLEFHPVSPAIEKIIEQQARIQQMLESPPAINAILEQNERVMRIIEPPLAATALLKQVTHIQPLLQSSAINTETLSAAKLASFTLQESTYNLATAMGQALESCFPQYNEMAVNLSQSLAAAIPKFDKIGEMALRLADCIPKIDHALVSIAQQAMRAMDGITESLQKSLPTLISALGNIDFSDTSHLLDGDFESKNEVLKGFGWYLISELPEEIVDEIYVRCDEITQEDVDNLIIQHFRENKCHSLKCMVNNWTELPYFKSRKVVFHEAQVSHSRRSYNASTTLISLHYEGVVTDFVRDRIKTPTYRAEKAIKCINDLANKLTLDAMPFRDWIICSYVLECVDQAFTTNFSPADPDSCPNNSRHKIAHGHATAKETEANSLRRFLFMNELYKLFRCLENEYQLAS